MQGEHERLWSDLAGYHADTMARHGATAQGAGWNGEAAQRIRFEQLCRVIEDPAGFSLFDLGCGYGALLEYLEPRYSDFRYTGCDVSTTMIDAARARHAGRGNASFELTGEPPLADYGMASGIFSLPMGRAEADWNRYLETTLDLLHRATRIGFAFNSLTTYSDPEKMRPDLHYANPCALFDRCKRLYSRNVALLHDYDLYDFTIIVRKHD